MARYEIIVHGVEHSQYFQGCGVSFTSFNRVVTGCGNNAKEAYEDAVEQVYMSESSAVADTLHLPKRPRGITTRDKVPARAHDEMYYYVSIRYNV